MILPTHGRYDFSPIIGRPDFLWPDNKRLAVYIALNLEHFAFGEGAGAELAPVGSQPDVLNYSWRDYGNRVGAWRLLELFDQLALPVSVLVNSAMYPYAPELIAAFRTRGDEMVGHGYSNSERQGALDERAEADLIAQVTAVMLREEGRPPRGWLSPWVSESRMTPDLLHEAGYSYLLDWCMDDQPVWMRTRNGRILSVPYPQELNDIPMIVARKIGGDAFADMIVGTFDEMLEQSKGQSLVMGIAMHPYLVGQPHRLRPLRRALTRIAEARQALWITTTGAIANHFAALGQSG